MGTPSIPRQKTTSVAYQNSGVRIDAIDISGKDITYYCFVEEIWELEYGENILFPLFWCQCVKHPNGVIDDNYGSRFHSFSLFSKSTMLIGT
jgi:hypothetical protein